MAFYFQKAGYPIQVSLLFIIFALIVEIDSINVNQNTEICKTPKKDPTFDPVWIQNSYSAEGSPFLFGNRAFRTHFAQLLKGRVVADEEDYSDLCATTVFGNSNTSFEGYYQGFGNLTYTRNCSISDGQLTCEFISNTNPEYRETATVHVTYFAPKDENHFYIVVYCLDNGKVGWALPSLRKHLPEEAIAQVLKEIELRGFDTQDFISLYENCENRKSC